MLTWKFLFWHIEYMNKQVFGIEVLIHRKNEKNMKIQSHFPPDLGEILKSRGFFWNYFPPDLGEFIRQITKIDSLSLVQPDCCFNFPPFSENFAKINFFTPFLNHTEICMSLTHLQSISAISTFWGCFYASLGPFTTSVTP